MRRSMTIALIAILGATAIALLTTLTSGQSPRLGLDLQGGASVVLTAQGKVSSGTLNQAKQIIENRVNGLGVAGATVELQGSNNIVVELPGVKNASQAIDSVGQTAQLEFRPVLLASTGQEEIFPGAGPPSASASAPSTPAPSTTAGSVPSTTVAPPAPSTTKAALGAAGGRGLAAQVSATTAGPTASSGAPATTGSPVSTAAPVVPTTVPASSASGPPITPQSVLSTPAALDQQVVLPQCTNPTACNINDPSQITARYALGPVLRDGNYLLTGQIVSTASTSLTQAGQWTVLVNFTGRGGSAWDKIVGGQYYNQYVAIILDNKVVSAPQIQAKQFNGAATISGGSTNGFSHSQASQLANVLKYGALPVKLAQSSVQTVSASLGKASLRAGLIAGLIGLGLVLLYMIVYYRALGIVVVVGLGISAALLYCLFTWLGNSHFQQSLSLASVVGVIVSVGVTADSYIVYFERLKDDIRAGKSVRSSVDKSFARAWRTIWTADLVSIIAAGLLWWLTIGDVRGFAFSLGLSTILDLITAYTFTRPTVFLLGRNRTFTEARFLGVARGLAATPAGGAA